MLGAGWGYVGFWLGSCWDLVSGEFMLGSGWVYVGFWLGLCWFRVLAGLMLGSGCVYAGHIMITRSSHYNIAAACSQNETHL